MLVMKQAGDCVVLGQPTYGSSGDPKPHELPNGVIAFVPSWQALLPDGTCFEGVGVPPDVEVAVNSSDFATTDPVLERALETLRTRDERD